jgi:hypothetical protein
MERPKALAAKVLRCHQHQHQRAQRPVKTYLEIGGAAQKISVADIMINRGYRGWWVENEAAEAHEV